MSSFVIIRSSRPEESCKKCAPKINIQQNLLKNIHKAVFNLIKVQAKGLQLIEKRFYFVERRQTATSEISSKNQNSST